MVLYGKNLNVKYVIYGGRNTHTKRVFFLLKIENGIQKGFHVLNINISLSCGKILQIFLSPHHATLPQATMKKIINHVFIKHFNTTTSVEHAILITTIYHLFKTVFYSSFFFKLKLITPFKLQSRVMQYAMMIFFTDAKCYLYTTMFSLTQINPHDMAFSVKHHV